MGAAAPEVEAPVFTCSVILGLSLCSLTPGPLCQPRGPSFSHYPFSSSVAGLKCHMLTGAFLVAPGDLVQDGSLLGKEEDTQRNAVLTPPVKKTTDGNKKQGSLQ